MKGKVLGRGESIPRPSATAEMKCEKKKNINVSNEGRTRIPKTSDTMVKI